MSTTAADLRHQRTRVSWLSRLLPGLLVAIVIFGGWELYVKASNTEPLVLPAPSAVFKYSGDHAGSLTHDAWVTLSEAAIGFALAFIVSITLAAAMIHARILDRAIEPVQTAIRCTPVIAVAPALMLSMGFGPWPKIIMAALITFAPFLVNATTGFRQINAEMLEVLESVDASRLEVFWHLRLPNALPYLFSAARVCVSLALMGAVVAEWTGSSEGLGYTIISAQKQLETTAVWACILILAFVGIVLTAAVRVLENVVLHRYQPDTDHEGNQ